MAKLIKHKLGITTGGYTFDFVFHRPVTVINGKSAIGKSLFSISLRLIVPPIRWMILFSSIT